MAGYDNEAATESLRARDRDSGLVSSHDSLTEQLEALAEDLTNLEKMLSPILREPTPDSVLVRAIADGLSPLHAKAEAAVNEVRWLRGRIQSLQGRVAL